MYGAITLYGQPFQIVLLTNKLKTGALVRFRSPLLSESRLISFPPATEMFHFTGFAPAHIYLNYMPSLLYRALLEHLWFLSFLSRSLASSSV